MDEGTRKVGPPDLVAALGTVADAMTVNVVTVPAALSVADAHTFLDRHGINGAPAVDGDRVVGVVTLSDLLGDRPSAQGGGPFLRPRRGRAGWRVVDVMTESVVTASPAEPLAAAVVKMDDRKVDRLPVVGPDGRPMGILARDDVVRALANAVRRGGDAGVPRRPFLLPD